MKTLTPLRVSLSILTNELTRVLKLKRITMNPSHMFVDVVYYLLNDLHTLNPIFKKKKNFSSFHSTCVSLENKMTKVDRDAEVETELHLD